jgi:hypothetical protein
METVRESWTDDRLDDMQGEMRRGFDRVDTDVRELRSEMNTRFDALQRTLVIGFAGIGAGVLASTAAAVLAAALG